jgi:AraC family transcriptional regulator of adaptative response / DNA-3-methyladenine glycosylase II
LRRLARQAPPVEPGCYRFRLSYRPPYDWSAVLAFLRARATPGVEVVDEVFYRRTIAVDSQPGVIAVSRHDSGTALDVDVRFPDPRGLLSIVERVRRLFDLGADPAVIAGHLHLDPLLRGPLARHPGIRTPGAWDGFELAVRAIVGQQISVRGATTLAGRLASLWGTGADGGTGLVRLFPTPMQLMQADVERAGVMPARADTIRSLARAVASGRIVLDARADVSATVAALLAVPGIGTWTAEYVAMRALGEPDAFPSGDLVLRRMAGDLSARALDRRSDAWRPWRSYAVMLLWEAATRADDQLPELSFSARRRSASR